MQRPDPRAPAQPRPIPQPHHLNHGMANMRIAPPQGPSKPAAPQSQPAAPPQRMPYPAMQQYSHRPGLPQPAAQYPAMQPRPGMPQPAMHQPGLNRPAAPQRPAMPQQGMPQQVMPPQGMPQPGMPQPGMPQPGMPQPGMPQPGMPPPGIRQPGMPQPGMQQSAMPPQRMPQRPAMQPPHARPHPQIHRPGPNQGVRPSPPGMRPQPQQPPQSYPAAQQQMGVRPPPPGAVPPPQRQPPPQQQSRAMGAAPPPMRPGPQTYAAPPAGQYPARPGYPQPPPGPAPSSGKVPLRPMRPVPPGSAQNGGAPPAPAPGQNGGYQARPQPPAVPGAGGGAPRAPAQLPSSAMPRPCATEAKCGSARTHFHRGMIANLDQNATVALIPSANADFLSFDDGSAGLRYMRLTTNAIASEPSVMSRSGVPLAIVMSPFADPAPGENPIPVVDFSAKESGGGPLRCEKCHAYANPGFKFVSGGAQFVCNLCRATCQTPTEHYSPISPANGLRMDSDTRHELRSGSVEYIVGSSDYWVREPKPASYVYAVDVSAPAIASGLAASAIASIKSALSAGLLPGGKHGARVGIFTFDEALHFYDARGADDGCSVSMHVVPDVLDPFLPLGGDGFLQTPTQAVAAIDAIVEIHGLDAAGARRRQQQQDAPSATSSLGSALQAILIALGDLGGKAFVISASIPSSGIAKLERRGGGAVGGGEDREMGLLKPATPDYEMLGCELADKQISVDLFLAPPSVYVDAATLVRVPRACGGRLFMFSSYDRLRDTASLHRAICTATSSVRAFEGLMRVRCSVGLETVGEFIGHFARPQRGDDVSGPVFDATTSTALELNVVSKLLSGNGAPVMNRSYAGAASLFEDVCVQCAVLFTDPAGRRRIRVHTMFANKTSVLADVFRLADVDATVAFLAKKAASAVFSNGTLISKAKEALVEKTVQALFVYRKRCTSSSMSGQLILPEALKTLPVTILGLTKSAAFRSSANSMQSSEAVTVDDRVAALAFLVCAKPADIAVMGYPRLWEVQDLQPPAGVPLPLADPAAVQGTEGSTRDPKLEPIALPQTVSLVSSSLADDKILLAENGMRIVVWLGDKVDKKAANEVVGQLGQGGRLAIRAETAGSQQLLQQVSDKGRRVAAVVNRVVNSRPFMAKPEVVVRSAAGAGGEARHVMPLLIEDRAANGAYSYVEFLRHVHKKVMARVANESAQNEMQTWELLNHGY